MQIFSLSSLFKLGRVMIGGTLGGFLLSLLALGVGAVPGRSLYLYAQSNVNEPRTLTVSDLRDHEDLSPLETVMVDGRLLDSGVQREENGRPVYYDLLTTDGGTFILMSEQPVQTLSAPFIGRFESQASSDGLEIREVFMNRHNPDRLPLTFFVAGAVPPSAVALQAGLGVLCVGMGLWGVARFVLRRFGLWEPQTA